MRALSLCVLGVALAICAVSLSSPAAAVAAAPAGFDCKMRHLVMEFAQKIQPFRGKSTFERIADELNLPGGDPGGATQCFNVTYNGPDREFLPEFPVPSGAAFFVDPVSGNDANPGTLQQPFRTLPAALAASRKITSTGKPASVNLRAGIHYIAETIQLTADDSLLTLQNYNGETPYVTGAVRLRTSWSRVRDNVFVTDLQGQTTVPITGLRRNLQRAFRARYPNGCKGPTTPSGYKCMGSTGNPLDGFGSSLLTDWVRPPSPTMNTPRIEFNPALPFRDSGSSFQRYQLGVGGGQCEHFVPPAGYWCGNQCSGGAPAPPDCIYRVPLGLLHNKSILPNAPYANPVGAVVQAWHPGHWASWMFEVGQANATHLMFSKGGFQGARGAYPDTMADTFFVENVIEELDFENEFFHDFAADKLYYYTNTSMLPTDTWDATQLKSYLVMNATMDTPIVNTVVRGITFRDAALTYLDAHAMPSGGDWALGRVAAVYVQGTRGVVFDSNTFERLDGNAFLAEGYSRDLTIQNNDFHEIGDNMIALFGKTEGAPAEAFGMGPDGTKGEQPRFSRVIGNVGYACGLFEKQSSFYFQAKSCQNLIQNNMFFHGPRAGINFNDGFGGASVLESNLLFNTVMESGDHGPFNSWDRQVYVTEVFNGTPSTIKAYDEIRGNFFVGNYYGQEAIDNDDGSAYFNTHHNFFAYADTGMKNDYNGHDNHHHNNIYAFISLGLGIDPLLPGHLDFFFENKVIQNSNQGYARYGCSCNNDTCPVLRANQIFTPDGTMGLVCGKTLPQRQAQGLDVGTTVATWPSDDDIIGWAREVLDLPASL